ncbi:MAG TPA: FtsX-like permease family protein, partial [Myxococcota bacterium]|nr:FtsX-like permease family protein [Myxococcota bacterium]
QPKQLIVQGLLEPGGIASAFGGQLAVMDIYALQNLVGREGWFDSVDVATAPDQPVEQVVALLNSRLDGRASVRAAGGSAGAFYEAVEMIQTTALLVAFAGAIAAALTAYATATQWVARQQRQLEILRSVGMSARRMQLGTLIEIALLSLGGFGLGLCGGVVLSPPMLATLSTIAASAKVEQLTRLSISPMTVVVGMLVGIVAPFAGSMIPIARSSRRFALDSGGTEGSHALSFRWLSAAGTLTGVFALSQLAGGYFPGGAFARVSTLFLSGIGLMFSLSPLVLAVWKHLLVLLRRSVPQLSHLVARSFISRPLSFAVSLCAIGSIVAVLTCLALVAKTFEASIDRWTSARYPNGARLVIAGSLFDVNRVELLTPATMRAIRTSKGVLGVDEQYRNLASVLYRGREVQLDMHDMAAIAKYGHIMSIGEDSSSLAKKIANGGVAVSSTFVRNFGLSVGDQLELNTPSGLESFPIVGVIEDFAGPVGTIMLDRSTFDEHWQRRGAWSATIWTEGSETNVVEEIRRRVGGVQDLYIADAEGMAKSNRASASVFNGVLSTIGAFMETLGGVAVAALLLGTIAERRRDLALLRAAGAEPGLLFLLVLADATVVCVSSCIAGLVLGLSCASPAVDVLRESYGWGLDQVWYTKQLAYLAAGTLALGLLGALAPARIAYRSIPTEAFAPD